MRRRQSSLPESTPSPPACARGTSAASGTPRSRLPHAPALLAQHSLQAPASAPQSAASQQQTDECELDELAPLALPCHIVTPKTKSDQRGRSHAYGESAT